MLDILLKGHFPSKCGSSLQERFQTVVLFIPSGNLYEIVNSDIISFSNLQTLVKEVSVLGIFSLKCRYLINKVSSVFTDIQFFLKKKGQKTLNF